MCGIAGVLATDGAPIAGATIAAMIGRLAHRGPDGEGAFLEGPIGLGHRRLSIIDRAGGAQPMHSADGHAVVSCNGEIYNHQDLQRELAGRGYPFRSRSDTEVIVALYQIEGEAGFARLEGMFAFALWDRHRRRLWLVRDRFGMKPLFYRREPGRLVFASEMKAIRATAPDPALEPAAVNAYFARQYVGGEGTIFAGIRKVPPGSWLACGDDGALDARRYWRLEPRPPQRVAVEQATERTDQLLLAAVRSHLISDEPVGVFTSGGLDSSLLLACASAVSQRQLHTFAVAFGRDPAYDESALAGALATRLGSRHHAVQVSEREVLACLPEVLRSLDQPFADYAILPTYLLSKVAASEVKVALSGDGADELFGGYRRYHAYAWLDRLHAGRRFAARLPGPCVFRAADRRRLLAPGWFLADEHLPSESQIAADKAAFALSGHLNSMLVADLRNWLADDLLVKVDAMGMLASLETRLPYLDRRLVEYVSGLAPRLKVSLTTRKLLLRRVAARRLPPEIAGRKKRGFTVPVGDWLRRDLAPLFREAVLDRVENRHWLDLEYVAALYREHCRGRPRSLQLWAVLIFCLWIGEHAQAPGCAQA